MNAIRIINANIIDGTGAPPRGGELLIYRGFLVDPKQKLTDCDTIDAQGLTMCPGFIDVHAHSDLSLAAAPEAYGKLAQGVTTEISGNCGLSPFPITSLNREHLQELYSNYNIRIDWNDFRSYLTMLQHCEPAINTLHLCGHNPLRAAVSAYDADRPLHPGELERMQQLLRQTLDQGCAGMSSGLIYIPGKFAPPEEITALLATLSSYQKVYSTHLRSEGDKLLEAVDEAINACRIAGQRHLHISHLKTSGPHNWHKLDAVFERLDSARANGLHITADRYPYTESMTQLSIVTPPPFDKIDDITLLTKLADPDFRSRLLNALTQSRQEQQWKNVRLVSSPSPTYQRFAGSNLFDIAIETGTTPPALCVDILAADTANTFAAFKGMSEDNLARILAADFVMCGSDESARPTDYSLGRSHPRGFASFPECFNRLKNLISIETIIHKFTGLPAATFNLSRRGVIAEGYAADLVLLDPARYAPRATFSSPHLPPDGVELVIVNGSIAYQYGKVTARHGKCLT